MCKSAPRSRQITTPVPHHSVFYRPDVRWLSKDYFARRCPRKHSKCWSQKIPPHLKCTSTLPCELWNCNAENYHQACTWTSKQSLNVKLPELKVYIDALITHNHDNGCHSADGLFTTRTNRKSYLTSQMQQLAFCCNDRKCQKLHTLTLALNVAITFICKNCWQLQQHESQWLNNDLIINFSKLTTNYSLEELLMATNKYCDHGLLDCGHLAPPVHFMLPTSNK